MFYLADTNILLRSAQPDHPQYEAAVHAVETLFDRGDTVCIVPQNLVEFWSVATRPAKARGGLGWTPERTQREVEALVSNLVLFRDTDTIHDEWLRLVSALGIIGATVHDARLVAAMRVHGMTHILSFEANHFARYPDITPVFPEDV